MVVELVLDVAVLDVILETAAELISLETATLLEIALDTLLEVLDEVVIVIFPLPPPQATSAVVKLLNRRSLPNDFFIGESLLCFIDYCCGQLNHKCEGVYIRSGTKKCQEVCEGWCRSHFERLIFI